MEQMIYPFDPVLRTLNYLNDREMLVTGGRYKRFPYGLLMKICEEAKEQMNK